MENVAILGASNNPSRYSYKAQVKLVENGHNVFPVSLKSKEILGIKSTPSLRQIDQKINTITVYINPNHLHSVVEDILFIKPDRVIFNPGSESDEEMKQLMEAGIEVEAACTLVLLATNQFEEK